MIEALCILPLPDPVAALMAAAGITAPGILEPGIADPRLHLRTDAAGFTPPPSVLAPPVLVPVPVEVPGTPAPGVSARPRLAEGMRLVPLSGFQWSGPVRVRSAPSTPRVRSDHVLVRVTQGMVTIDFPRHNHAVPANGLAFIPAGTAFAITPLSGAEGQALLIPPRCFGDSPLPATFRSGMPAAGDADLLDPTMRALALGDPRDAATACRIGLLSVALSRLEDRPGRNDTPLALIAEARPLTERFLHLARQELHLNQTIAEMARRLGCSLAHLDRACQQSRGRRALELLYDLRLHHATEALRDSARPLAEIAQDLGYAGLGHFTRAFLAATGRTPQGYRHLIRDGVAATG